MESSLFLFRNIFITDGAHGEADTTLVPVVGSEIVAVEPHIAGATLTATGGGPIATD